MRDKLVNLIAIPAAIAVGCSILAPVVGKQVSLQDGTIIFVLTALVLLIFPIYHSQG